MKKHNSDKNSADHLAAKELRNLEKALAAGVAWRSIISLMSLLGAERAGLIGPEWRAELELESIIGQLTANEEELLTWMRKHWEDMWWHVAPDGDARSDSDYLFVIIMHADDLRLLCSFVMEYGSEEAREQLEEWGVTALDDWMKNCVSRNEWEFRIQRRQPKRSLTELLHWWWNSPEPPGDPEGWR